MASIDGLAAPSSTEVRILTAPAIPQDYRISIALPRSYASQPERSYPTIYVTDAIVLFGMITDITRLMNLCGQFPETIIVGIGYPVNDPLDEALTQWDNLRARDLTPIADLSHGPQTGGAPAFLSFIKTDLIPMIEREYRADPTSRVLAGFSYGGLFVLHALFHQPDLFKSYIAGSPPLTFGNRVTFTYEAEYAAAHTDLAVNLYFGVGGEEEEVEWPMVSEYYKFAARLQSRKYEGFSLTTHVFENCTHCAAPAPFFQAGLQAVLSERQQ
ncbi:hypothetical protein SE17_05995 [Kouleothrix aurantiaca]|uniref:Esterase n=1 Tax=Kouleothrix aurantiaca TaxID=186479 RepID=A0A0P9FBK3_9CHLR|nr:hypothetical protein SE17_05995 [Kouleothrix aurantiaca]